METKRTEQRADIRAARLEEIVVGGLRIGFQRTVRVPAGQTNPLPAGLGNFPIYKVSDFSERAPKDWRDPNAYFMPMYVQEALWVSFPQRFGFENPHALVVGAGHINAVTGKPFEETKKAKKGKWSFDASLQKDEQNYLVVPPQPWLDGWKSPDGKVYQFVSAQMGSGLTVEGQITGEEKFGGIQLTVHSPKPGQDLVVSRRPREYLESGGWSGGFGGNTLSALSALTRSYETMEAHAAKEPVYASLREQPKKPRSINSIRSMGLGRGGEIEQKIYPDPHGYDVWDAEPAGRATIYLVNSEDFEKITGQAPPQTPITIKTYQQCGMPWFLLPDGSWKDTAGSDVFGKLKPVVEK